MPVHERYKSFLHDQRQFFDELITEDWDLYKSEEWDRTRTYEIDRLFEIFRPATILDIGCGCGFHDQAMAQHPFVESVDAIDYSPKSVERANMAYPHPKVRRWTSSFTELDDGKSYDMVVSFQVIEHLDDPAGFLHACARACRVGGMVAIFTPNRLRVDNAVRMMKGVPPQLSDPMHFKEYVPSELAELARPFGLVRKKVIGVGLSGYEALGVKSLTLETRMKLGRWLPKFASGFGLVLERRK